MQVFSVEYSSTSAVFSFEILTEEIELVVAENYKFEYRSKLKKIALFGFFGLSRICCMNQNKRFVN